MNIISDKSFEDYKQAKKELEAITAFLHLKRKEARYCKSVFSKYFKDYGIDKSSITLFVFHIIEEFFEQQKKNKDEKI